MDTITREIILKLTARVSDLEAAVQVHRGMLKELMQAHAAATGTTVGSDAFDLHIADLITQQREKKALAVELTETPASTPMVLDLPEVQQD